MNKKNKSRYKKILEQYPLPLIYSYAKETRPEDINSNMRLFESSFYQTKDSLGYFSKKPISKIL